MKFIGTAIATALTMALAAGTASPAAAQAQAKPKPQRELKLSSKAQKPIIDLQTAVKAKNAAVIPDLVAKAQAAASTADDRYAIGTLMLQAAVDSSNYSGLVAAANQMAANGAGADETSKVYLFAAQKFAEQKQYGQAMAALDGLQRVDPNNSDALLMRSEYMYKNGQVAPSLEMLSQAIARSKASGQPVPADWYSARVARAYDAKLPSVYQYSREWVASAPTPAHWKDTINIYRNVSGLERAQLLDLFRLARVTKSLSGEGDYATWGQSLINRGYPSEALALLQEGAAGGTIKLTSPGIAPLVSLAKSRSAGEKESLEAAARSAPTAASAAPAMRAADALFDAGEYARAGALYRTALTKSGVDKDVANLRLGMSLAMMGDKAGATASLQAVGGQQAEIAKYWMTYVATRA